MQDHDLSEILKAVSDPTRRSLLTTLVQEGPLRVTELAGRYAMSLNAVSKHIKVLEAAGLATRRTMGRVHLIEANLDPVRSVDAWFGELRSIWELRLDRLGEVFSEGTRNNERSVTDAKKDDPGAG
ncbi:ArsR/SmtB family transcription factor [Oricola cellulosilytica]|uniref:ArsR family transcriptional regulator n=1 Tax=Oricola cellulosilytica TaxID=1429082 RepID=A0A4R0PFU8_9HYPH|nr:metalloregulator ArsR/SmtB family transcription factor [Oricola cellulosilytica]TCD16521.1 ArsR family transcriptional regulator [Oricola cellulosilytica]